jgi:hypothetical protein
LPIEKTADAVKAKGTIPVIDPRAVFTIPTATRTLELARNCLPREARLGRLRVAKRAGRYFILGAWLLEWIEGGELRRHPAPAGPAASEAASR